MKLVRLLIENVFNLERLEVSPGSLTLVRGPNRAGKTNFVTAVKSLFRGGADERWIRRGASEGKAVATIDDAGTEITVERRFTKEGCPLTVKAGRFGKVPKPQRWLDELLGPALTFDPGEFLRATLKGKTDLVCAATESGIDIGQTVTTIALNAGIEEDGEPPLRAASSLDHLRQILSARRKAARDGAKGAKVAEEDVLAAAGLAAGDDAEGRLLAAEKAVSETRAAEVAAAGELRDATAAGKRDLSALIAERTADTATSEAAVLEQARTEVEVARQEMARKLAALDERIKAARAALLELEAVREGVAKEASHERLYETKVDASKRRLAHVRSGAKEAIEAELTAWQREAVLAWQSTRKAREDAERTRDAARRAVQALEAAAVHRQRAALEEDAALRLDRAVRALDVVRAERIATLGVPGLAITDGKLTLNGEDFDVQINRERQVAVAVRIAALQAGPLGLVIADDLADSLDEEHWAAEVASWEKISNENGLKLFVTKIDDEGGDLALNVTTTGDVGR